MTDRPNHLTLDIPYAPGEFFTVELETNKILSDNFVATAMIDGQEKTINYQSGLYYKGKIHGQSSTVAISFNLINLAAGNYTISVTDANNCPTTSQSVDLIGSPIAAFDTSAIDRTITLTNQSQFGASYLWDFGDGNQSAAPAPTHTYQNSGDFTITLITTNDCGSDAATTDITVFLVGINTVYDDQRISIYPNPTTDILTINFDILGDWQLKLYDVTGRLLIDNQLNINKNNLHQLNVSTLANGTYLLRFQSLDSDLYIVKKILIQK